MMSQEKYCVITGASQGLGKALACELAQRNKNLILVSLPNEGLDSFARSLEKKFNIKTKVYEFNLTNLTKVLTFCQNINESYAIHTLINNAGVGGTKEFLSANKAHINTILQLNVVATSLITHQLIKNLSQQHHAYILNIASLAALSPIGYKTVYPASKAFVHNFSLGLAEELKDTNISVSVVHPGAMKTNPEVTKRVEKQGFIGKLTLLELDTIAKKCIAGLYNKKKVIVLNPFNYYIMKLLPTSLKTKLITKGVKREIHE